MGLSDKTGYILIDMLIHMLRKISFLFRKFL